MKRASVALFSMLVLLVFATAPALAAEPAAPAATAPPAGAAAPAPPAPELKPGEPGRPYVVGDKVGTITLKNLEGKEGPVSLEGTVVALSFFSSSCSACRQELAFLDKLAKSDRDLRVVGISVDFALERMQAFANETKYPFDFYLDPDYKTPQSFGFASSPAVVLLNKEGKVAFKKMGYGPGDGPALMKAVKETK